MQAHKQLPNTLRELVTELTMNVESLVDMREMVVSQMEGDRRLMVRMFLKVGQKEINFIWHISADWNVLWYFPDDCLVCGALALDTILGCHLGLSNQLD
jgi:aspartokinase